MKNQEGLLAGLIAGTSVDTALGSSFLQKQGWEVESFAISRSPQEQNNLQQNHVEKLQSVCLEEMMRMQDKGVKFILIYCSSLSSVLDMASFREILKTPIYTPLNYYSNIANSFNQFGVIAANAIGLNGFESAIAKENERAEIVGMHNINIVREIENAINPKKIVDDFELYEFIKMAEKQNCECIVLACTHFTYIKPALVVLTQLPVLDIDSGLLRLIKSKNASYNKPGT